MSTALLGAIDTMPPAMRARFLEHLDGGTSADYLAGVLKRYGQPVSATTIRTYRRAKTNDRV